MYRIGFEVPEWSNKPFHEFTDEGLLEYWHKLRLVSKSGVIDTSNPDVVRVSGDLYIVELHNELLRRMSNRPAGFNETVTDEPTEFEKFIGMVLADLNRWHKFCNENAHIENIHIMAMTCFISSIKNLVDQATKEANECNR